MEHRMGMVIDALITKAMVIGFVAVGIFMTIVAHLAWNGWSFVNIFIGTVAVITGTIGITIGLAFIFLMAMATFTVCR